MTSSSGKRIKTIGSKRKDKDPERSYANKFLSRKHERHFKVVQDRRLLMERKAGLIPDFAPQFGEKLENRNLGRLATYPASANIAVVKEFNTNCQFALNMEEGSDFGDVESVLCVPGGNFQRNRNDVVVNIKRVYMTPLSKYWMAFSHAKIQPCSHVSDITISRALLLYCVLRGMSINIGQVIANEIQVCANTMNNKAPLGHPSLITHLCELTGVNISAPPFERPRKAIDEAYYKQYCGGDEVAQPVPPRQGLLQTILRERTTTWTMDEFHNVVAWPEEQAQDNKAGAAEASAMDDEDDEDDFEDAEDDEEEKDTDDSMG
ncbi:hypothetical protein LR48_Vigan02g089200 [Vigna angularis]|uniref:Putative plant transposon protein domain-containing protein n=1 Tax=Phaseolus angularis TaxID=3914 RepID=A0A0L9TWF3_PHAAN|nr:hypothetical protein LR48_Vigan02g089200 [Vigna angularis]